MRTLAVVGYVGGDVENASLHELLLKAMNRQNGAFSVGQTVVSVSMVVTGREKSG